MADRLTVCERLAAQLAAERAVTAVIRHLADILLLHPDVHEASAAEVRRGITLIVQTTGDADPAVDPVH